MEVDATKQNKQGFTLVEVVVSITLIAFVALFLTTFIMGNINAISQTKQVTTTLFSVQNQVETHYEKLTSILFDIQELQKKLKADPTSADAPAWTAQVTAKQLEFNQYLANHSADLKATTFSALGVTNIPGYSITSQEFDDRGDLALQLDTVICDIPILIPDVPEIDTLDIKISGQTRVIYFAQDSDTAESTFTYSNDKGKYMEVFQWYQANPAYHSAILPKSEPAPNYEQPQPAYPGTSEIIPGKTKATLEKVSDYKGRMLVNTVIPVTAEGIYGKTVASNFIYVSALPELATGKYVALFDPSFYDSTTSTGYDDTTKQYELLSLSSELAYNSSYLTLESSDGTTRWLSVPGINSSSYADRPSYTRYLPLYEHNTATDTYTPKPMTINLPSDATSNLTVIALVRSSDKRSGTVAYDSVTNTPILTIPSFPADSSPWYFCAVQDVTLAGSQLVIGPPAGSNFNPDIAELILIKNATEDEINSIKSYLGDKYLWVPYDSSGPTIP